MFGVAMVGVLRVITEAVALIPVDNEDASPMRV